MDLTAEQKTEVCDSFGDVIALAFPGLVSNAASVSQGVRQALDQNVTDPSMLLVMALAREQDKSSDKSVSIKAVERAAAARGLLRR